MWRNTPERYGRVSRLLHWWLALLLIGLLALGVFMTSLTYYSPHYKWTFMLHKSAGLLVLALVLVRIVWSFSNPHPVALPAPAWQQWAARAVHWALYGLMLAIPVTGYLISTADGHGISVYDWFEVPALFGTHEGLEETAGLWHRYLAYSLGALVLLHAAAALKHHVIDRDATLRRMLGR